MLRAIPVGFSDISADVKQLKTVNFELHNTENILQIKKKKKQHQNKQRLLP